MDRLEERLSLVSMRRILQTWWPLAVSWLLMSAELPALSAFVARLANPEINLAAYGGIVYPLALIIESPVIMLLSASTALSKDWNSYKKINRFMMVVGAGMTVLHLLIAFTPLYYLITRNLLGAPEVIIGPARFGLMILIPWTWSIAYRRFHQGVLIRFGHSKAVWYGTAIRLGTNLFVLAAGFLVGSIPGVVVAASAVACGVVAEAIYAGIVVQPVLKRELKPAPPVSKPVTLSSFLSFYIPLAMTSLLSLLVQPIGSAALSRMPLALESLAVWSVASGLVFMVRSLGVAYNEVVIALLDEPGSSLNLKRFSVILSTISSLVMILMAATPLGVLWFSRLSALDPQLTRLAVASLWISLPMPLLGVLQSWFQGAIMHGRQTRGITEAVIAYLAACSLVLGLGIAWGKMPGIYIGSAAFVVATIAQTAWLGWRSRPVLKSVQQRDELQTAVA